MAEFVDWNDTAQECRSGLEIFLGKTKQQEHLYELLKKILPSAIDSLELDLNKKNYFNILSVGSGNGQTDLEFLKILKEHIENIRKTLGVQGPIHFLNYAIEPDQGSLHVYSNNVERLSKELDNIAFDLKSPRSFESHIAEHNNGTRFDIVHFFHCFYHLDIESALVHCYNSELRKRGMIIICLAARNHVMWAIAMEYNRVQVPFSINQLHQSIDSTIAKYGWKYEEFFEEHDFDVSDVFDENSKEGNALLDFLTIKVSFRKNNSAEDVQHYLNLIKNFSITKDGKYFAKYAQRIIIIFK